MWNIVKSLYLNQRFYLSLVILIMLFIFSYILPQLYYVAVLSFFVFLLLLTYEIWLLYRNSGIEASRLLSDRFSNGDQNPIKVDIRNLYAREIDIKVIDEIPPEFQRRDLSWNFTMEADSSKVLTYELRPVKRGVYSFGALNIYASCFLQLLSRRFRYAVDKEVVVYPSYLQMKRYELAAISKNLTQLGIKKLRRIGTSMEFEQIKNYVRGDDPRNINWKASARANNLMVNQFQDEKSQQVYCLVDKGRLMKMPFSGMSLLDYAINATLVISNIAIQKGDKSGFISFSKKLSSAVAASKKAGQMTRILEGLYNQKTKYEESNYELLTAYIRKTLSERSLLLLFTNFESLSSLRRQLPYLKILAKSHVLIVIFFRNTGMKGLIESQPMDLEKIYHQTIAEHIDHEKDLMIKELKKYGIHGLVSIPEHLTVDTINKYLEVKARLF